MLVVRSLRNSDTGFIFSTMLKGLYFGCDLYSQIDRDVFYAVYPAVVQSLLDSGTVRVAVLQDDEEVIVGYSVTRGTSLDWVFVKHAWRRQGVAKLLLQDQGISSCSHLTKLGNILRKNKQITFNPFYQLPKEA